MNWVVVGLVGYLFVALQLGLAPVFDISTGWGTMTPRLILVFAVYLGLLAPPRTVVWAWGVIGLLMDLVSPLPSGAVVIGPYTIGYLIGGVAILQLRGMVLRTHPVSHAFCLLGAGIAVHLIATAIFGIRQLYDPVDGYSAGRDMIVRIFAVAYTVPFAAVIAWPLVRLSALFGVIVTRGAR